MLQRPGDLGLSIWLTPGLFGGTHYVVARRDFSNTYLVQNLPLTDLETKTREESDLPSSKQRETEERPEGPDLLSGSLRTVPSAPASFIRDDSLL